MVSYDSDSSDNNDYTETTVLLGYASKEPTDDTVSQLGGLPTWIDSSTTPSGSLAKCKICSNPMSLLLQLNGDMPDHFPGHERRLYLFGCKRRQCGRKEGSIRGIRGNRVTKVAPAPTKKTPEKAAEPEKPQQPAINLGAQLFGVAGSGQVNTPGANPFAGSALGANPFSTSSSSAPPANPFANSSLAAKPAQKPTQDSNAADLPKTFADKVRVSSPPPSAATTTPARPHEPWPTASASPAPYPRYYLDADYETLDATPAPVPQQTRVEDMDIEGGEGGNGGGAGNEKDLFESSMDKTFQRFADRVAQNAEQVLRYEFRGSPLLYSKDDKVGKLLGQYQHTDAKVQAVKSGSGIPRCQNCGAERVFEAQLMPQAIAELEADDLGLEGMDWGTVILGVCSQDCFDRANKEGDVSYLEEWVGVQWEEMAKR